MAVNKQIVVLSKKDNILYLCSTLNEVSKLLSKSDKQIRRYKIESDYYDSPLYTVWFNPILKKGNYKGQSKEVLIPKSAVIKTKNRTNEAVIKDNIIPTKVESTPIKTKLTIEEMVKLNDEKIKAKKQSVNASNKSI